MTDDGLGRGPSVFAAAVLAATVFAAGLFASAATATAASPFAPGALRAAGLAFAPVVKVSSSQASASSSDIVFAYISSDARIFFALTYICFSPVERPFSPSRSARFRTTSASS